MRFFSFYPQASDVGETHSFAQGTVSVAEQPRRKIVSNMPRYNQRKTATF